VQNRAPAEAVPAGDARTEQQAAAASPSADEMHDFEAVIRLNVRILPKRARKNIEIALDRHAIGWHFEVSNERSDGEAVWNFALLAVDCHVHRIAPAA
jgi:hypothetical protein